MSKARSRNSRKRSAAKPKRKARARKVSSDSINVPIEIARLQSLNELDYERQRMAAAKRLGMRVSKLDTVVCQGRRDEVSGREGRPATTNSEPWTGGPLDGAKLLDDVATFCSRFVAYPSKDARTAHVLWIGHSHFMDRWDSTPRLAVMSEEPTSGKSRLLEVTEYQVPNPVMTIGPSESYLFRKIGDEDFRPTILFDEIDTVFGPKAPPAEGIRRLLNAGHRKSAKVGRTVVGNGRPYTEDISAYAAVAVAGLHSMNCRTPCGSVQ
jgi:hypothetical protein